MLNKVVVRTTCPKCNRYYELDCELTEQEIAQRHEGKIDCPCCQEDQAMQEFGSQQELDDSFRSFFDTKEVPSES